MPDFSQTIIRSASVHFAGNKTNGEELILSKTGLSLQDGHLTELLLKYFLGSFNTEEFYRFTFTNGDFNLNPLYTFAKDIFNGGSFHINTVHIARHLHEIAAHPQIKGGDLFVVHFGNIGMGTRSFNAVGIFKSENRYSFLKLNNKKDEFTLDYDDAGINIEKLDKGCLILDTAEDEGFRVCIVDRNRTDTQFWKDDFLMLEPCKDDYHHTKDFLTITKNYVTKQLPEDFEVGKTDQIDFLNRSLDYFKKNESFNLQNFETEVFRDPGVIESFRKFDETYRKDHALELEDSFDISGQAVKKQARVYKSVLKLDKNFHIYIHGDKNLIERGTEKDGRKFYKIYFEDES